MKRFLVASLLFLWLSATVYAAVPTSGAEAQALCNFENHHSHLVVPLSTSEDDCKATDATFLLSHGATFFCPHTFDVKLLAKFANATQQAILCENYFDAVSSNTQTPTSIKFVLRPTLPVNGLPLTGAEIAQEWTSPVLYYVHSFGNSSSAGPGDGWDTTTLIDDNITVTFPRALYFREFDISTPKPTSLSYLIYWVDDVVFLTHYITSAPNFDQILFIDSVETTANLRRRWPLRLEVTGVSDTYDSRLVPGQEVTATILSSDAATGLPVSKAITFTVGMEVYNGVDDGFADFGFNCPFPPPYPQARGMCAPDF